MLGNNLNHVSHANINSNSSIGLAQANDEDGRDESPDGEVEHMAVDENEDPGGSFFHP